MRLVRICVSYLWPASLPNEPMVRSGLEGWTHVGSGLFCTSVFTSGSISEGEGVSLAPAIALCFPRVPSSSEPVRFSASLSQRAPPHPLLTGAAQRRRDSVSLPPAASRAAHCSHTRPGQSPRVVKPLPVR